MRAEYKLSGFGIRSFGVTQAQSTTANQRARVLLLLLAVSLSLSMLECGKEQVRAEAPAPEVEVTPVAQQDVPLYTECISTLDGFVNAQIQPQVTGYLLKQNYREGTAVQKGDVLFEIDPRPFEALLSQTQGQL